MNLNEALPRLRANDTTLIELSFYYEHIGVEGAKEIADALKSNTSLTMLELWFDSIGDEGAKALAIALKSNNSLTTLSLHGNQIGDDGAITDRRTSAFLHLRNNDRNWSTAVLADAVSE